jgi:ATP-binding cassette subfamily B multidrug efflux pump
MPAEKALSFTTSGKRLLRRLQPERSRVLVVIALAIVSIILTVVLPKIFGWATDIIFDGLVRSRNGGSGIDFDALRDTLLLAAVVIAGASAFGILQALVLNGVVQRTVHALRTDVERKIHRLPLSYFDTRTRGEVLSRVTNDIDNIAQSLQQTMSRSINALLTVAGVLAMMFWISPLLAVIGLVSVPLSIGVTAFVAKRSQKLFVAQWRTTGELNGHIEEAFTGHALVKMFGRETQVRAVFATKNDELYRAAFGAQFLSSTIMPLMFFIGNVNYVLLAVVGGLRVSSGAMSVGDVQAFIQYSRQFTQPLTELASMMNTMQSGVASAERVFELLDADELSVEPAVIGSATITRGRIAFEHVDFSYRPDTPLICDLSFVANPGQSIAIVGHTGAGKTTLVNLIMRFYEIDRGRITLDDVDIATLSRHELRSKVGMVLQDTWLFEGTIRDNIAYGNLNATDADIEAAAKATFVDRFVHALPGGYETRIDAEASNISAGEKQLITIARAFLADPALLILDEATSSVDTRTEVLVQHAMAALRSNRTSFIIAHRLSTIRDADLILVMDSGRIVEQGAHDELLQRRGAYFEMYNAQFAAPSTDLA